MVVLGADLLDLPTASEIVDGEVVGDGRPVPWAALPEVVVTCHTLGVPVPTGELWCHDRLEIVLHPQAPLALSLGQLTSLRPRDLRRVAEASELREVLRRAALRALQGP